MNYKKEEEKVKRVKKKQEKKMDKVEKEETEKVMSVSAAHSFKIRRGLQITNVEDKETVIE